MVKEYVVVAELPVSVPEIVPIDESPSKLNPPGKLPAPVDQFGAILEDKIAVELLTAPPSLFSTLTK